jgi:hypothetical protein
MRPTIRLFRKLVELRSKRRRWVYIVSAFAVLLLALFAAGMGGIVFVLVYIPILAICVVQYWRPTLLGWFLLTALFSSYAIGVIAVSKSLNREDLSIFSLIGLTPTLMLLCSWPKPALRAT